MRRNGSKQTTTPSRRSRESDTPAGAITVRALHGSRSVPTVSSRALTVGSDPACDCPVKGPDVGGQHVEIYPVGDLWWVRDLGTDEGTYLNGEIIDVAPVAGESVLQLGPSGPMLLLAPVPHASPVIDRRWPRSGRLAIMAAAAALVAVLATAWAQTTELHQGRIVLTQPNGAVSIELDGNSDLSTFNDLILGRADVGGALDADVDLEVIDPNSTLDDRDQSFILDASSANLIIGSGSAAQPGSDGDLLLQDGSGETLIDIDGSTGNINQDVDNLAVANGNGAVKAWAKINADGTVFSCWKCNLLGTGKLTGTHPNGEYEVDFDLGNIAARPKFATATGHTTTPQTDCSAVVFNRAGDTSSVQVRTRLLSSGALVDRSFTVFVF